MKYSNVILKGTILRVKPIMWEGYDFSTLNTVIVDNDILITKSEDHRYYFMIYDGYLKDKFNTEQNVLPRIYIPLSLLILEEEIDNYEIY